jgi:serine protease AprX
MKKILLFLLTVTISYSQNEIERNKIIQSSNSEKVQQLKEYYQEYFENQNRLIEEYHLKNNTNQNQKFSLQRIIDGIPFFYETDNAGSATTLRANSIYPGGALGLNVTGQGLTAGVWDGGKVRNTHVEFTSKITLGDGASTLNGHATHVTGTIVATGVSSLRRGVAYQALAKTHDWTFDIGEMVDYANLGFLVSNHSYGNIAANLPIEQFGMYNGQSVEVDNVMNAFPYYQIVKSAGNDRNNTALSQVQLDGGFDLLSGVSTAKNVLTVAAVNQVTSYNGPSSVVMSDFSNFGPTDDGRIKPDISAKGVGVSSTNSTSDSAYTTLQGTSMASPAISGLILLLQKHFNNLNATTFMRSATVRGLLCHSAREAGIDPGPDYMFGWGLADAHNAAQVISNRGVSSIIDERTLGNNSSYSVSFTINSVQDINVALAWTDPTGVANIASNNDDRTPRLVNNLDLKVIKDGTTYYPWKLDPDFPNNAATNNSDNDVDNIERVEIFNAQPGIYTINVTHKGNLEGDMQDYSLIASTTNGLTLNNTDFVADNNFFVYPSPADNTISFSNPNNYEVASISIADVSGKQVLYLAKNAVSDTIDVSNLQSGVYFVTFTSDNISTVKKFIKK